MYDHHGPYTPASAVVRHVETTAISGMGKRQPFSRRDFGPERQHIAAAESPELCSQVALQSHRSKRD